MKKWWPRLQPFLSVIVGLCVGVSFTALAGENPIQVLFILAKSAFGSPYDLGMTLFYSTPLVLTGLAVAVPFHAGLFNIGAEGQLNVGAMACTVAALSFQNLPWPLAPLLGICAAFLGGALWGAIPGWLLAQRKSHEVITTIMLNFVAAGLVSYVTLYGFRNPESQNPETRLIAPAYWLKHIAVFGDAPVSVAIFLVLAIAGLIWFFLWKTVSGFELRAVGENPRSAQVAGISSNRVRLLALTLGGGLAGLVGVPEVLGNSHQFRMGFSPEYGFTGIAVALLGRGSPIGVLGSALLFGALHKGTADLDFETKNVSRDLSMILQAIVILIVSAEGLWSAVGRKWLRRES